MRFHLGEAMTAITNYIPLAQAAEANGYTGYTIPDSLIYPEASDTSYDYTDTGDRTFLENKPFVETFTLAMALGAVTERLELTTNILKLPVRPPLYSAKIIASIAAMTNNRFNLGCGLSVWPEDYAAMGVPYAKRGARFDECIDIVRGLMTGDYFEHHGEFYDIPRVKLNPVPTKPVPILIGGHSDAALRRGARNDGQCFAGGADVDLVAQGVERFRAFRKELGREDKPYRLFTTYFSPDADIVARFAEIGITDLVVSFRDLYAVEEDRQPLQDKLDDLKRFADEVIAKA